MKKYLLVLFLVGLSNSVNATVLTLNSTTGTTVGDSLDFDGLTITLSGGGSDSGSPYANASGVNNSNSSSYPTSNDIVFTFDSAVANVDLTFNPYGLSGPGRGDLWIEAFLGSVSLGLQEVTNSSFHTESLYSFGTMTSFVVNNGCDTASGDTTCSWISLYKEVSYDSVSVPEPTSLALLGLGLAGFGFAKKKKSA